jgi:hypothetical protein
MAVAGAIAEAVGGHRRGRGGWSAARPAEGESVTGIALEGERETGESVLAPVFATVPPPPCAGAPGTACLDPTAVTFVESFRVK